MKKSLMANAIQYWYTGSGGGTLQDPIKLSQMPGGSFITALVIYGGDAWYYFKLTQGGKQLFPLKSKYWGTSSYNFYAIPIAGTVTFVPHIIAGLWIPINSTEELTCEFADPGAAGSNIAISVVMASEDMRSLELEELQKLNLNLKSIGGKND